jgi:hypothetical protein
VCPASGVCEQGPIDGICSNQRFFQCRSGTGTEDCEDIFPGAGTCVDVPRPCFGATIERTGTCGVADAALAAVYCMPATRAAAINTTAGSQVPPALPKARPCAQAAEAAGSDRARAPGAPAGRAGGHLTSPSP